MTAQRKILEDLEAHLASRIAEGERTAEFSADFGEVLKALSRPPVHKKQHPVPNPTRPRSTARPAGDDAERLAADIAACALCSLQETRTNVVPGQGSSTPEIMFVGEAPGADEDRQGLAFVGRAGKLLTKMIEAMGFKREDVFIGNILKCRPPNNRPPMPDEMATCLPFLKRQIALLKPKVIICLGSTAVKGLLDTQTGITKLRGTWLSFEGIDVMPTFHPAYLLRNPSAKKDTWEDLKAALARIGREPPPVTKGRQT